MIQGLADKWFQNQAEKQQQVEIGIAGFTAMAMVDQAVTLKSEAPVYYLEDGSAAQDHIILKPESIRITGEVGDVWVSPDSFKTTQAALVSNVGKITSYLPAQAQAMQQKAAALINDVEDKLRQIDGYMADGAQALSFLGLKADPSPKTVQEEFIGAMKQLFRTKQLFSVDMPFERYENMYIETLVMTKGNQSNSIKYDLTATKIRIADSIVTEPSEYYQNPSTEAGKQVGDKKPSTITPKSAPASVLSNLKTAIGF